MFYYCYKYFSFHLSHVLDAPAGQESEIVAVLLNIIYWIDSTTFPRRIGYFLQRSIEDAEAFISEYKLP